MIFASSRCRCGTCALAGNLGRVVAGQYQSTFENWHGAGWLAEPTVATRFFVWGQEEEMTNLIGRGKSVFYDNALGAFGSKGDVTAFPAQ